MMTEINFNDSNNGESAEGSGVNDGVSNDILSRYGHIKSRAEILRMINTSITPEEAELLMINLELSTRRRNICGESSDVSISVLFQMK